MPEWHCPRAENDLRIGGVMRTRMATRNGSMGFDFEGTLTEVVPQQRLAYTLGKDREVVVSFHDTGDRRTEATMSFTPENLHPVEFQTGD